ncbi:MAG: hypothetical protein ACUVRZ_10460 [Desulfobacca sp.]|uniref:hypothetical protein n=1 Tax=Desulfobacca sp. TaxID=2067990 RepID=UPI00404AF5BB
MLNEIYLRTWHRRFGIILALFVLLQTASGLILNVEHFLDFPPLLIGAKILHLGGGLAGTVYRIVLGFMLIAMVVSGSLIFLKVWRRIRKK